SRRRHTRLVSDWSSDVCSSDLVAVSGAGRRSLAGQGNMPPQCSPDTGHCPGDDRAWRGYARSVTETGQAYRITRLNSASARAGEIGRASCREREEIAEGAVAVK